MAEWMGIDGCRSGWVAATLHSTRTLTGIRLFETFSEAVIESRGAVLTLVDIPIGLPSQELPRARLCDGIVRKNLGSRASSVFPVPAREAVWAVDYEAACRRNEKILGVSLSRQSWSICPKIRDVDSVFRIAPALQTRIRETHPELCFRLLNNGRVVTNPKKSPAGQRVRRELLRGWTTNLDAALKEARRIHRGAGVDLDDLLDAVAASIVARLAADRQAASVPLVPECDACGLRMEIVGV
jgi:predicted RNase H-like nuclease